MPTNKIYNVRTDDRTDNRREIAASEKIENVQVAFLCCIYEKHLADYILRNESSFPQVAANNLGWLFANGLKHYYGDRLNIFSVLAVSGYPRFRKMFINPVPSPDRRMIYVKYLNIPILKHAYISLSALGSLVPWAFTKSPGKKVLIVYSMSVPFPFTAWIMSKLFGVKIVLIAPDLPEYMRIGVPTSRLLRVALAINKTQLYYFSKAFDGYVFLTKYMAEKFRLSTERFTVIEGCVPENNMQHDIVAAKKEGNKRIVYYAGNLNEAYGVKLLLEAFQKLPDPSYRLWLCGRGTLLDAIEAACRNDPRITYYGVVSHQEAIALSLQATALINPRTSTGEFTKYSFPSKVLEYMNSGRPVIMCRLPGMPEEYYQYVYMIDNESSDGFAKTIDYVLSRDDAELEERGNAAKEFVRKYKNSTYQTGKLFDLIRTIVARR